jgi:hypothetical protein
VIRLYGQDNWAFIAEHIPGKTGRQCRERWLNHLSPDLNTRPWTREEDALLFEKYAEFGSRWVDIARFFPHRTDAMVKNRFLVFQRRWNKLPVILQHRSRMS